MIIGVSGKARSGKGEFARIAKEEFGATVVSFAGPLKEEVGHFLTESLVQWDPRHLYGGQEDKEELLRVCLSNIPVDHPFWPQAIEFFLKHGRQIGRVSFLFNSRTLMQYWGKEFRRENFGEDYWVKKALAQCSDPDKLYVIDDVRFPNEAQGVLDAGGKLVRVSRPNAPQPSNPEHPSETALDAWEGHWDYAIFNCLSLRDYHEVCRDILEDITK